MHKTLQINENKRAAALISAAAQPPPSSETLAIRALRCASSQPEKPCILIYTEQIAVSYKKLLISFAGRALSDIGSDL